MERIISTSRDMSTVTLSDHAKKLAEIQTTEVKKDRAKALIPMVGMVFEDETRVAVITSRVDGGLDEIYVTFTGEKVNKGDPCGQNMSPTLIKGQVELFETIRTDPNDKESIKGGEEKLVQWVGSVNRLTRSKRKSAHLYVTLKAPISGIVTKKKRSPWPVCQRRHRNVCYQ